MEKKIKTTKKTASKATRGDKKLAKKVVTKKIANKVDKRSVKKAAVASRGERRPAATKARDSKRVSRKVGKPVRRRRVATWASRTIKQTVWAVLVAILMVTGTVGLVIANEPVEEPTPVTYSEPEEEPEPEPEKTEELEVPEETPENERGLAGEYTVPANRPRLISIPSAGIYARVMEVGKVGTAMDAPKDERLVGWYNTSALPGQAGASVFDGHGGSLGNGIFKNLGRVKAGDRITVEMGDRATRYTYRVAEVVTKTRGTEANRYMPTAMSPLRAGVPTLTLITCTGEWIRAEQTYTQRLFVRAVLE